MKNILTTDQAQKLGDMLKEQGKKTVLVGGCFDILHIGHISLLENAKKQGDILIVLLESDQSITQKKGSDRPLHTQQQRAEVLAALRFVDYIILLPEHMTHDAYDHLVKAVQPDIMATTENDPGIVHKKRQASITGAQVVTVNQTIQDISTSRIVSALHKEL